MNQGSIGIFDSGVGGLSVWEKISKLLPWEDTVYIADQKFLPYGEKTTSFIRERTKKITKTLIEKGVTLVVVACNTATVQALDYLRKKFKLDFVGIEPGIKPAVKLSQNHEIAVIATSNTIKNTRYKKLIAQYARGVKVNSIAAPELVDLVELGDNGIRMGKVMDKILNPANLGNSDVIALASTHFSLIKKEFENRLNKKGIHIVEPSAAVVSRVSDLRKPKVNLQKKADHTLYTTGNKLKFKKRLNQFFPDTILKVERLDL